MPVLPRARRRTGCIEGKYSRGRIEQLHRYGFRFQFRIVAHKKMNQCEMVEVQILILGPYPEIGPINLTDPMRIVEWTKDGLTATGDTHLCQRTQLNVDFVHRKVQLVATPRCPPGGPAVIEEVRTFPMFEWKNP